jgi:hypothetical protein
MLTAAKLAANRANALKSTGPRTPAGKARAAQNARRHGLRAAVLADAGFTEQVNDLARRIAGKGANPEIFEAACRIAEAQLDYVRARTARISVWKTDPDFTKATQITVRRLLAINRHEHRILSRRKFALRDFDAACSAARWFPPLNELPKGATPPAPTVKPAGSSARTNPSGRAGQDSARTKPPTGSAHDDLARTNPSAGSLGSVHHDLARTNPSTGGAQDDLARTNPSTGDAQDDLARTNPSTGDAQDDLARTNPPTGSVYDDLARTNPTAR